MFLGQEVGFFKISVHKNTAYFGMFFILPQFQGKHYSSQALLFFKQNYSGYIKRIVCHKRLEKYYNKYGFTTRKMDAKQLCYMFM